MQQGGFSVLVNDPAGIQALEDRPYNLCVLNLTINMFTWALMSGCMSRGCLLFSSLQACCQCLVKHIHVWFQQFCLVRL